MSDDKTVEILEVLDPMDPEHLAGFRYFREFGEWPEDILPANVEFTSLWVYEFIAILANKWIECRTLEALTQG